MLQEDNFETEWRKSLGNAKFTPSDALWEKIYIKLNPNYRFILSIIFILWVVVGGIGFEKNNTPKSQANAGYSSNQIKVAKISSNQGPFNKKSHFVFPKSLQANLNAPIKNNYTVEKPNVSKNNPVYQKETQTPESNTEHFHSNNSLFDVFKDSMPPSSVLARDSFVFKIDTFAVNKNLLELTEIQWDKINSSKKKISLQLGLSPIYYNANLKPAYQDFLARYIEAHNLTKINYENYFQKLRESYRPLLSYQADVAAAIQLSKKFTLRTGFSYQIYRFQQQTNAFFIDPKTGSVHSFWCIMLKGQISNNEFNQTVHNHPAYQTASTLNWSLSTFNANLSMATLKIEHEFISVPVILEYWLDNKKLKKSIFTGVYQDFMRSTKMESSFLNNETTVQYKDESALYKNNTSWMLGFQIVHPLKDKLHLGGQFFYRSMLKNQIGKNGFTDSRASMYGLGVFLRYDLR